MIIQKQDESYTLLISESDSDKQTLQNIYNFLKSEKPDAKYNFRIQKGWESPYNYFSEIVVNKDTNQTIMRLLNGHMQLLTSFGINVPEEETIYTEEEVINGLDEISGMLPFNPHDYQYQCAKDSLLSNGYNRDIALACTSSGKSCMIFLIMYFLYKKGKVGYLIVPNVGLLTQLYQDFHDYFDKGFEKERDEFLNCIDKQGGGNKSDFNSFLTISTWQSLNTRRDLLERADFILCDELHKYSAEVSSEIVIASRNAKQKFGLTGTLPEDGNARMMLIGMFGLPKRYIRACELIERGLATPVEIISFIMKYSPTDRAVFNKLPKGQYAKQLAFIKEHEKRHEFIVDLTCKVRNIGNTIVLGTHTEHIKTIFIDIMKKLYPDVEVQNKDITGKKSFEFQKKYGVYFVNGEDNAETRELTRKILEEKHYIFELGDNSMNTNITLSENDYYKDRLVKDIKLGDFTEVQSITLRNEILISNFQIMSTGVNIKRLFNVIFASPLKSYTTITQGIGRGLRLHPDKKLFRVFDIVDDFGTRKVSGIFAKQYEERKRHSYNSEGYPITEKDYILG